MLKNFLEKNKEIFQLVYGIFLIILIPLLITYNTVFIIKKYNENFDTTLQRNALTTGRLIAENLKEDLSNDIVVQEKVEEIIKNNKVIENLTILKPKDDNFLIIASSEKNLIGNELNFPYYSLAWTQNNYDSLVTDSFNLAKNLSKEENNFFNTNNHERFWILAMPINDYEGKKSALLSVKISSQVIDSLTKQSRDSSLFLLVITIAIVIMFLLVAVRLWDYVLLYKKIKEVDAMKDEFISMASHELRTPVTGIRGYASMILDGSFGKVNKKIKEAVEIIANSSERLAVLVEDLLNVSRIEQGRLSFEKKKLNPFKIISETVNELDIQAKAKNLKLIFKSQEKDLPIIEVDEDKLKQILINLIGNSIKYTEKGSVEILTTIKDNKFEIKIKDTGIGMSEEERNNLFKKFYRIKNEKTKNITGTGLGLWITKQIVEMMKGKISVESIKNVGTQISVEFFVKY